MVEFRVMIRISADELKRKNRGDKMVQRISNLPDGCNRLDEPWTREHINGYETHEEYILNDCFFETITKENFTRIMADEIKEVELQEEEIEFLYGGVKMYTEPEMQIRHRSFGSSGYKETVGFTVDGALSGKEQMVFTIEDNELLQKIKAHKSAQLGEEINWWDIYSTQEEIDAAVARTKRAHRTNIIKIELDVPILRKATEDEIGDMETCLDCKYFKRDYKCHLYGYKIPDCAVDHTCGSCRCNW